MILLLLFTANSAYAFEPSGSVWATPNASFHVGINGISPSGESWNAALSRAMQAWTDQTTFAFEIVNQAQDPCDSRQGALLGDGKSSADFTNLVCDAEFGNNVLAVTLSTLTCQNPACTGTALIEEADIVFNNAEQWDVYSGPIRTDSVDFERVALHELGHAIGLNHEVTNAAIMQASLSDLNTLQTDDINGANFIYGVEVTFDSIYGIEISLPEIEPLAGVVDTLNFSGELSVDDQLVDNIALDIYQLTFANDINITVELSSTEFDPLLYLVRVDSTQLPFEEYVFADDNSGPESAARIAVAIPAGTYWLGATAATANSLGSYAATLSTFATNTDPEFEEYQSVYGPSVQINPNPVIGGMLSNSDFRFENKFLDLYQFNVQLKTDLRIDLTSSDFDTKLILVEIQSDQTLGSLSVENDDNGVGTNSRIEQELTPGTYWIGVTSFANSEVGEYQINVSVNVN